MIKSSPRCPSCPLSSYSPNYSPSYSPKYRISTQILLQMTLSLRLQVCQQRREDNGISRARFGNTLQLQSFVLHTRRRAERQSQTRDSPVTPICNFVRRADWPQFPMVLHLYTSPTYRTGTKYPRILLQQQYQDLRMHLQRGYNQRRSYQYSKTQYQTRLCILLKLLLLLNLNGLRE